MQRGCCGASKGRCQHYLHAGAATASLQQVAKWLGAPLILLLDCWATACIL